MIGTKPWNNVFYFEMDAKTNIRMEVKPPPVRNERILHTVKIFIEKARFFFNWKENFWFQIKSKLKKKIYFKTKYFEIFNLIRRGCARISLNFEMETEKHSKTNGRKQTTIRWCGCFERMNEERARTLHCSPSEWEMSDRRWLLCQLAHSGSSSQHPILTGVSLFNAATSLSLPQ